MVDTKKLEKGTARRLYGTPQRMPVADKRIYTSWMGGNAESRSAILPTQDPGIRLRGLNKLSRMTATRRDPTSGERSFLLHRGMSDNEYGKTHGGGSVSSQSHSSWTPDFNVAQSFKGYYKGGTTSAWIKESDIHSLPFAHANFAYNHEKEVIVKPGHKSQVTTYNEPAPALGDRLKAFKKMSLYKSDTIEDRIKAKYDLKKSYDESSLNKNKNHTFDRALDATDAYPGWEDHNTFVHHGVNATVNDTPIDSSHITSNMQISSAPTHSVVLKSPLDWKQVKLNPEDDSRAGIDDSHLMHPMFRTTHREAMFDLLANNVFGLKSYVPPTSLIKHPGTGDPWSAQVFVPDSRPAGPNDMDFSKFTRSHEDMYKVGIMDTILGNNDRHLNNVRIDGDDKLHLIDNAMAFDYSHKVLSAPTPVTVVHKMRDVLPSSVHDWIKDLDNNKMASIMRSKGVPESLVTMAMRRLNEAKRWSTLVNNNPSYSKDLGGLMDMVTSHRLNWDNNLSAGVRDNALDRIKRGEVFGGQPADTDGLTALMGG